MHQEMRSHVFHGYGQLSFISERARERANMAPLCVRGICRCIGLPVRHPDDHTCTVWTKHQCTLNSMSKHQTGGCWFEFSVNRGLPLWCTHYHGAQESDVDKSMRHYLEVENQSPDETECDLGIAIDNVLWVDIHHFHLININISNCSGLIIIMVQHRQVTHKWIVHCMYNISLHKLGIEH